MRIFRASTSSRATHRRRPSATSCSTVRSSTGMSVARMGATRSSHASAARHASRSFAKPAVELVRSKLGHAISRSQELTPNTRTLHGEPEMGETRLLQTRKHCVTMIWQ